MPTTYTQRCLPRADSRNTEISRKYLQRRCIRDNDQQETGNLNQALSLFLNPF